MARIPLVPADLSLGSAPDDGTGSTLRAGGQVIKDWMTDINAMTAELYALLGDPSNMVTLGGQALRRTAAYINAPTTAHFTTIAFKFRAQWPTVGNTRYILGDNELFIGVLAGLDSSGQMTLSLRSGPTHNALVGAVFPQVGSAAAQVFTAGQTYSVLIVADRAANTVRFWLNGVEHYTLSWFNNTNPLNFSLMTTSSIAATATPSPGQTHTDLLGYVWIGAGTTSEWAVTDPTKFYDGVDVYLGPNGQRPNGLQPLVFVGGTHLVNEWLAGANFGYGGNFTVGTG
jgi:hypothetical protein